MINTIEVECLKAMVKDQKSWPCHLRVCYLNSKSLNQLASQCGARFSKFQNFNKTCDGCLVGKHPMNSFKVSLAMKLNNVLEVVHSDSCGPFEQKFLGEIKFFFFFTINIQFIGPTNPIRESVLASNGSNPLSITVADYRTIVLPTKSNVNHY